MRKQGSGADTGQERSLQSETVVYPSFSPHSSDRTTATSQVRSSRGNSLTWRSITLSTDGATFRSLVSIVHWPSRLAVRPQQARCTGRWLRS